MARRSAGNKSRDKLKIDAGRQRIGNGARRLSKHKETVARRLDRLASENTELRAKAINLMLEIQTLRSVRRVRSRERDPDERNRGSSSKIASRDNM
jgi:hypothetical protein